MTSCHQDTFCSPPGGRPGTHALFGLVGLLVGALAGGCTALTNPVANGIPARRVPDELRGPAKQDEGTIPLMLLRQQPPEAYRLAPGDLLGVWIEGVTAERGQPIPVHFSDNGDLVPALGHSYPVLEDGTVRLPLVDPVRVQGLTQEQADHEIHKAYTVTKRILRPGRERIVVTLQQKRHHHVLVIRQDAGGVNGSGKRGTGHLVDLPAYQNDVLSALALTGGLPGLEAKNKILIYKGCFKDPRDGQVVLDSWKNLCVDGGHSLAAAGIAGPVVRIPLRLRPGEHPPFGPEDIVLETGDVVLLEVRDTDLFYTGGLLPVGEFILPQDHDLDVVEAISRVAGPIVSDGIQGNNLSGTLLIHGLGFPAPSQVLMLRRTPGGGQVPIRVDLNRALRDPRERLLIQPGDVLLLQETPSEALARWIFHCTGR